MTDEYMLSDPELDGVSGGALSENDGLPEVKYCWNELSCPKGYWKEGASNETKKAVYELHNCEGGANMGKIYCPAHECSAKTLLGIIKPAKHVTTL